MQTSKRQRLKLNEQEKRMLNHHIASIEKMFLLYVVGGVVILIGGMIWYHITGQIEFSLNSVLYATFAYIVVLIIIIVFGFLDFNYFNLKEDKIELKKVIFFTKIHKIQHQGGTGMEEVKINIYPPYNGKHSLIWYPYLSDNLVDFKVGTPVQITATANAGLLLKIESNPAINSFN